MTASSPKFYTIDDPDLLYRISMSFTPSAFSKTFCPRPIKIPALGKIRLTIYAYYATIFPLRHGDIAQLVERLNGIQEVRGSTPLISTKNHYT